MTTPRVLIAAPVVPEWDRESGWLRLLDFIEFLREAGSAVSFVAREGVRETRYTRGLHDLGVPTYPGDPATVEALVESERFDLAILVFWYVAESYLPILRRKSPDTRVVVDTVDLHFLRNSRKLLSGSGDRTTSLLDSSYGAKMSRELNTYVQCDAVLAVSKKEADLVDDLAGEPGLSHVVPDAVTGPGRARPFGDRNGVVFVGNFRHDPNVLAVSFLLHDVLPHLDPALLAEHPVGLVGNALERAGSVVGSGGPYVRPIGWVPSVAPYLERARVSVIPVLYGAGTKRKLLQSMAAGTPTVATSIGAEGLGLVDGEHFLLADDPAEFAHSISRLLTDPDLWARISVEGRGFVDARYSREVAARSLTDALSKIAERPSKTLRLPLEIAAAPVDDKTAAYEALVTRIRQAVTERVPSDATVLVITRGDAGLLELGDRAAWHFPQTEDGIYAGHHPPDSDAAIRQLEALRRRGAAYLVIPSTAFWWLDHYGDFARHLAAHYEEVVRGADCIILVQKAQPEPSRSGTEPRTIVAAREREQEPAPIIVFGAPRSGTTYLARILNEHPEVFVTHETRLFVWVHRSLNELTQDDEALLGERSSFVEHLRAEYPQLVRDFYRKLRPGARYWGDKNPHYASSNHEGCLDTIDELFPGTRFIQIIRDGRDVVASLIRKRHPDGRPWIDFVGAHNVWTSHLDIGCGFGSRLPSDRYLEVRYEDLITDDEKWALRLFEFLGIPIRPEVLDFCRSQQEARTPFSEPTRDLSGGVGRSEWATVLTKRQQRQSLELIGEHLVRYGYADEEEIRPPEPTPRSKTTARTAKTTGRTRPRSKAGT